MGNFSETFSTVTAPGQIGAISWLVKPGDSASYTAAGDVDALCTILLDKSTDRINWTNVTSWTGAGVSASGTLAPDSDTYYRFRVAVTGAGSLTTFAVGFSDTSTDSITVVRNSDGTACLTIQRDGITVPKLYTDTIGEQTAAAGVTIDGVKLKDSEVYTDVVNEKTSTAGVTLDGVKLKDSQVYTDTINEKTSAAGVTVDGVVLKDGAVYAPVGAATPAVALGLGSTAATGAHVKVIDETVSLVENAALYKAMTTPIPAGAVILSVQANVQAALTGGSTTVKVGLGPNASDPDKYGKTSDLTQNQKINTIPDWAVLSAEEAIDICSCATGGGAGDTALTVGSVRVRIVYLTLTSLANT